MPKVGPQSAHFSPGCVEDVWPRHWHCNKERSGADSIPPGGGGVGEGWSTHHYVEHERNLPLRAKNPYAAAFHLQSEAPAVLRGESPRLFLKAQLACRASIRLHTLFFFFPLLWER